MIKLGELDTSLEDVNGYLQQVEDELSELDLVHGDPKYLETHIKKLKVLHMVQIASLNIRVCIKFKYQVPYWLLVAFPLNSHGV